mmetsp:Transcript_29904/g.79605  ORF Transcript_29904/g.79605 Transcript_29904/m.79605 type:complete len:210 (-) Transcript_29904:556-1185(-)
MPARTKNVTAVPAYARCFSSGTTTAINSKDIEPKYPFVPPMKKTVRSSTTGFAGRDRQNNNRGMKAVRRNTRKATKLGDPNCSWENDGKNFPIKSPDVNAENMPRRNHWSWRSERPFTGSCATTPGKTARETKKFQVAEKRRARSVTSVQRLSLRPERGSASSLLINGSPISGCVFSSIRSRSCMNSSFTNHVWYSAKETATKTKVMPN